MNKLQAKVLPNAIHGDSRKLTPSKVNVFYGLVDVNSPSKVVTGLFLIHHLPLLPDKKCEVNNIS